MASIIGVSQPSALEAILKTNQRVVVDFYTETCIPCRVMEPIVEKILDQDRYQDVTLVKFNANDGDASGYGVRAVPTIVVFKSGSEVLRHVGTCTQEALATKFDSVL